ncbi:hypothetical protein PR048_003281 [Dryococelus australis]|uniref:Peptidase S1 domain-containing protein n=1 Tax=Dryococelus australis TaxID=614101 RepID=A0ABQ9INZ0_9NEOP|nr:hypothetical protein PR048_003281 [Dryococelus australis]
MAPQIVIPDVGLECRCRIHSARCCSPGRRRIRDSTIIRPKADPGLVTLHNASLFFPAGAPFSTPLRGSGGVVVRLLAHSPPTWANRVLFPAGSSPDFCMWESCQTIYRYGRRVFSGISSFPRSCIPALLHINFTPPSSALTISVLRAAPNLFTHLFTHSVYFDCPTSAPKSSPALRLRSLYVLPSIGSSRFTADKQVALSAAVAIEVYGCSCRAEPISCGGVGTANVSCDYRASSKNTPHCTMLCLQVALCVVAAAIVLAQDSDSDAGWNLLPEDCGRVDSSSTEHPWTVLLEYTNAKTSKKTYLCLGAVINKRYVITAAHCIVAVPGMLSLRAAVRLGTRNLSYKLYFYSKASFILPRKVVSYSAPTETASRRVYFRPPPVSPPPGTQTGDRDSTNPPAQPDAVRLARS